MIFIFFIFFILNLGEKAFSIGNVEGSTFNIVILPLLWLQYVATSYLPPVHHSHYYLLLLPLASSAPSRGAARVTLNLFRMKFIKFDSEN